MSSPSFAGLSFLLLFSACATSVSPDPFEPMSKAEARAAVQKGDHFAIDFCAIFDWYGDDVCDDFCASPDPDCAVSCEDSDCGPQPLFQPRVCENGDFIFPSSTCEPQESGSCGWTFETNDCPEDRVCGPMDCPPGPSFQPRRCENGTFVHGSQTCEANMFGECGWDFQAPLCPEDRVCEETECGPQPLFQPQVCEDGTFIFPQGTCGADAEGECGWSFSAEECPEEGVTP